MNIHWITPLLGTGPFSALDDTIHATVVDVRELVDKSGNDALTVRDKINEGMSALKKGGKVIVCCDYGMSRSNAVAAGILALIEGRSFDDSLRKIMQSTGETQVNLELLNMVRSLLGCQTKQKKSISHQSILVTGGSGFIGHTLKTALDNKFNVFVPSHAEIDLTLGSTLLDLFADDKNIDCIVHLANPRIYTSNAAMGQTLTMLRNVIDICLVRDIPLLYPSGWEIYSGYSDVVHVDEATLPLPKGPYGETKYLAETLIGHCVHTAGLRCALLRSSPVYGKGGDRPKFIYNFIEKALHSKPIITHRYRNGEPALDLLYIDDLIAAVVTVIQSGFIGILNLGTGTLTSTRQVAQMISDKLNSLSRVEQRFIDADVANIFMDYRQARQEIGWEPKIQLSQGIDLILSNILDGRKG